MPRTADQAAARAAGARIRPIGSDRLRARDFRSHLRDNSISRPLREGSCARSYFRITRSPARAARTRAERDIRPLQPLLSNSTTLPEEREVDFAGRYHCSSATGGGQRARAENAIERAVLVCKTGNPAQ